MRNYGLAVMVALICVLLLCILACEMFETISDYYSISAASEVATINVAKEVAIMSDGANAPSLF